VAKVARWLGMACTFAVLVGCAISMAQPAAAAGAKIVVFPFDLIDDSQEGEADGIRADQTARLKLATEELKKLIAADGRYEIIDSAPIAAEIEEKAPIYKCNGCEDALAKKAGADLAVVATIQKVSNLILNMNLFVRDVNKERTVRAMSTDIRGNTDESWLRGVKYITKNQFLAEDPKQ